MRKSRPRWRRCAASDRAYGPAPTTAVSMSCLLKGPNSGPAPTADAFSLTAAGVAAKLIQMRHISEWKEAPGSASRRAERRGRQAASRPEGCYSTPSLALQDGVDRAGIGLAVGLACITWPTNQPIACGLAFTASAWPGLAAISSSTRRLQGAGVADLREAARLDDLGRRPLPGPHALEHLLGDLGGDHRRPRAARPGRRHLRRGMGLSLDVEAVLGQARQQFVGDPVGDQLGVAALRGALEIVGARAARSPARRRHRSRGHTALNSRARLASGSSGRPASISLIQAGSSSSGSRSGSGK